MAKQKYVTEYENGDWNNISFDREVAKKNIEFQKKYDKSRGRIRKYKIKTPDKVKIGKTRFPQDPKDLKWKCKPNDLVVVESIAGTIDKKPIRHNQTMLCKNVAKYINEHALVITGIHTWEHGTPAAVPKKKKR